MSTWTPHSGLWNKDNSRVVRIQGHGDLVDILSPFFVLQCHSATSAGSDILGQLLYPHCTQSSVYRAVYLWGDIAVHCSIKGHSLFCLLRLDLPQNIRLQRGRVTVLNSKGVIFLVFGQSQWSLWLKSYTQKTVMFNFRHLYFMIVLPLGV